MAKLKLTIAYNGTSFLGWQKTPYGPSVEESLEKAFYILCKEKPIIEAASRTDAGVHARAQVVSCSINRVPLNLKKLTHSLQALVGSAIAIKEVEEVDGSFHPTIDNVGKCYHYNLCYGAIQSPFYRETSWHYPFPLDLALMQKGAMLFEGYKDFSTFCNEIKNFQRSTFCRIDSIKIIDCSEQRATIEIIGSRFLYKMVRNIVGTLAYIGAGKIPLSALEEIIGSKTRAKAGITAPAHGLFLHEVYYAS
jgi:tRNA pseudouridine38-40 synthase